MNSLGYIGPGAGLGAIGALLAVVGVLLLTAVGLILYPLAVVRNWFRVRRGDTPETPSGPKTSL